MAKLGSVIVNRGCTRTNERTLLWSGMIFKTISAVSCRPNTLKEFGFWRKSGSGDKVHKYSKEQINAFKMFYPKMNDNELILDATSCLARNIPIELDNSTNYTVQTDSLFNRNRPANIRSYKLRVGFWDFILRIKIFQK